MKFTVTIELKKDPTPFLTEAGEEMTPLGALHCALFEAIYEGKEDAQAWLVENINPSSFATEVAREF